MLVDEQPEAIVATTNYIFAINTANADIPGYEESPDGPRAPWNMIKMTPKTGNLVRIGRTIDQTTFNPLAATTGNDLDNLGLVYDKLVEIGPDGTYGRTDVPKLSPQIREVFKGPLILNSDFDTREKAQAAIDSGVADGIAFGRTFLANPDLPERLRTDAPLNEGDMKTWYSQGPEGYIDYPTLDEAARAA